MNQLTLDIEVFRTVGRVLAFKEGNLDIDR